VVYYQKIKNRKLMIYDQPSLCALVLISEQILQNPSIIILNIIIITFIMNNILEQQ
jgi:hypothetical protein